MDYLFLSSFVRPVTEEKILGENNYERRRQPAEKHGGTIKKQEIHRGRFEKEMRIPKTNLKKKQEIQLERGIIFKEKGRNLLQHTQILKLSNMPFSFNKKFMYVQNNAEYICDSSVLTFLSILTRCLKKDWCTKSGEGWVAIFSSTLSINQVNFFQTFTAGKTL